MLVGLPMVLFRTTVTYMSSALCHECGYRLTVAGQLPILTEFPEDVGPHVHLLYSGTYNNRCQYTERAKRKQGKLERELESDPKRVNLVVACVACFRQVGTITFVLE